jgi:hypothetical protein
MAHIALVHTCIRVSVTDEPATDRLSRGGAAAASNNSLLVHCVTTNGWLTTTSPLLACLPRGLLVASAESYSADEDADVAQVLGDASYKCC